MVSIGDLHCYYSYVAETLFLGLWLIFFFFFFIVGISSVHTTFKWWSYRLNKSNAFPELCVRGKNICNVEKMVIKSYLLYTYCTMFSFTVNVTESSSWKQRPSLKLYLIRYMKIFYFFLLNDPPFLYYGRMHW